MNNVIVRERAKLSLVTIAVAVGVLAVGRLLSPGSQRFTVAMAAGLVFMLVLAAIGWIFKGTAPVDPAAARQRMPARSRRMKIVAALALPIGIGVSFISRFALSPDLLLGVALGILLFVGILIGPAFWRRAKPNQLLSKRTAPLEDPSHTMVVPPVMNQGANLNKSGEAP